MVVPGRGWGWRWCARGMRSRGAREGWPRLTVAQRGRRAREWGSEREAMGSAVGASSSAQTAAAAAGRARQRRRPAAAAARGTGRRGALAGVALGAAALAQGSAQAKVRREGWALQARCRRVTELAHACAAR